MNKDKGVIDGFLVVELIENKDLTAKIAELFVRFNGEVPLDIFGRELTERFKYMPFIILEESDP